MIVVIFLQITYSFNIRGQNDIKISRIGETDLRLNVTEPTPTGTIIRVEASYDLMNWREFIQSLSIIENYPIKLSESQNQFFRINSDPGGAFSDWTNFLDLKKDNLFSAPEPNQNIRIKFLKFTIKDGGYGQVIFQNSKQHPFHYPFARLRIPEVANMSSREFFRKSLYNENQSYVLGTLLLSTDENIPEIGIQFSGAETFESRKKIDWIKNVISKIKPNHGKNIFYISSIEQVDQTNSDLEIFQSEGIRVSDFSRWISEDTCYSKGWTIGQIKFVPGNRIKQMYLEGSISERDILYTDILPSEIPRFSGILLKNPAGPNSHAILLAKSHGIPVGFFNGKAITERLDSLVNRTAFYHIDSNCQISIQDLTDSHSQEEINAILETKNPPKARIKKKQKSGEYFSKTDLLSPSDIIYFGGKASNMGVLTRSIPNHHPAPAVGISFDLWDDFMNEPYRFSKRTLGDAISDELSLYSHPPDIESLHKSLFFIRKWIKETSFPLEKRMMILNGLSNFDPLKKIRFRSSTNVEDSDTLSGAGLYDSFSGCLADDLDDDDDGPSHCDPFDENERGVFRAIKKVYASFYNDNAFLERLRHGVDEQEVGMAILSHYSFQDKDELANGVVTAEYSLQDETLQMEKIQIIAHPGPESVSNPDNTILPEITIWSENRDWHTLQMSSLSQEGAHAMTFESDYQQIKDLTDAAAREFLIPPNENVKIDLDLEFKKMRDLGIIIKQIRKIPTPYQAPLPDL